MGDRWIVPPLCKELAGGTSASRRRWCPNSGKVFLPSIAGCGPGLPGLEPDVSRRSFFSGEPRLEGAVREPALATRQNGDRAASKVACSIGGGHTRTRPPPPAAGDNIGSSRLTSGCPPLRKRATGGRGHPERSDPMDVEAAQGEVLQHVKTVRSERGRIGAREVIKRLQTREGRTGGSEASPSREV